MPFEGKIKIHMVDLVSQYQNLKEEIDQAILDVVASAQFIKGPAVKKFEANLAEYLGVKHVIGCANGTDALQIALMALRLQPGDEVIVPAFTYVATAEVIGLLNLKPVMVDVRPDTFNTSVELLENAVTSKTKAIVPVHLFGQSTDMAPIMEFCPKNIIFLSSKIMPKLSVPNTLSLMEILRNVELSDTLVLPLFSHPKTWAATETEEQSLLMMIILLNKLE